jgi:hypothetical protein
VRDFYAMLAKMDRTYTVDAPLWVVLSLTDLKHVPSVSMATLRQSITGHMEQFDRVLVGTMEGAEVIERPR